MTRFHINRSPKINTEKTKLLAIAATVITAAWIADTVKEAKNYPFLCSYGSQCSSHSFIDVQGKFRCVKARLYEAWMFPLGLTSTSSAKTCLILIRPVFVGLLVSMMKKMYGYSLLNLMKKFQEVKEQEARLLIPKFRIPLKPGKDVPEDLRSAWNETALTDLSGISPHCEFLDHLFHYGSLSFTTAGLGFATDKEEDPSVENAPPANPFERKPRPELFNARFDTPFVFVVVDCATAAPLSIGSYAGPKLLPYSYLNRPKTKRTFCEQKTELVRRAACVLM
ncbi:hypothetical protein L596_024750 [Steinernema carpocapsae]|uniref:Serpin domain-containing protein n=1 Tax=Steinernema carpocapsae TaxID=34508 RepID=A0A4U5M5M7_STECR|nr:hypothetical protein L596_024750 [Steinernema carpocapsae]